MVYCTYRRLLTNGLKKSLTISEGEEIDVIVLDVDQRGRIKLSIKEIPETNEAEKTEHEEQA